MGELGELAHPWITVSIEIAILKIVIDLPFSLKYQKIAALEMRKMSCDLITHRGNSREGSN